MAHAKRGGAVSAHGAAVRAASPRNTIGKAAAATSANANHKTAAQILIGHSIHLKAPALECGKRISAVDAARHHVGRFKTDVKRPLDFEIHRLAGGRRTQQSCGQQQSYQRFLPLLHPRLLLCGTLPGVSPSPLYFSPVRTSADDARRTCENSFLCSPFHSCYWRKG